MAATPVRTPPSNVQVRPPTVVRLSSAPAGTIPGPRIVPVRTGMATPRMGQAHVLEPFAVPLGTSPSQFRRPSVPPAGPPSFPQHTHTPNSTVTGSAQTLAPAPGTMSSARDLGVSTSGLSGTGAGGGGGGAEEGAGGGNSSAAAAAGARTPMPMSPGLIPVPVQHFPPQAPTPVVTVASPGPAFMHGPPIPSPTVVQEPMQPPKLTEGLPTPDAVDKQRTAYSKNLEEQLQQNTDALSQQLKQHADYLQALGQQQKKQYEMMVDQQIKQQEMELMQEHNQQLMLLQQEAQHQRTALDQQANALVMEYNHKKAQEDLMEQHYQFQREQFQSQQQHLEEMQRLQAMQPQVHGSSTPSMQHRPFHGAGLPFGGMHHASHQSLPPATPHHLPYPGAPAAQVMTFGYQSPFPPMPVPSMPGNTPGRTVSRPVVPAPPSTPAPVVRRASIPVASGGRFPHHVQPQGPFQPPTHVIEPVALSQNGTMRMHSRPSVGGIAVSPLPTPLPTGSER
mmetsp:Transcript_72975/g.152356  ORF Transcript_72975/g.152356 Transcript_72975/m.152356 type:complete len:507 (-) Transcript_72975:553-2073(-)